MLPVPTSSSLGSLLFLCVSLSEVRAASVLLFVCGCSLSLAALSKCPIFQIVELPPPVDIILCTLYIPLRTNLPQINRCAPLEMHHPATSRRSLHCSPHHYSQDNYPQRWRHGRLAAAEHLRGHPKQLHTAWLNSTSRYDFGSWVFHRKSSHPEACRRHRTWLDDNTSQRA